MSSRGPEPIATSMCSDAGRVPSSAFFCAGGAQQRHKKQLVQCFIMHEILYLNLCKKIGSEKPVFEINSTNSLFSSRTGCFSRCGFGGLAPDKRPSDKLIFGLER